MRIAILGAGLQGCGIALEFARRGIKTDLYDLGQACLTGASREHEGKLHLGFVYGNDPSLATAKLMVRGALSFEPIVRQWLGSELDRIPISRPFFYAVAR